MKTGRSIVELATELERQRTTRRDFVAPVSAVSMTQDEHDSVTLNLDGQGFFPPTEIAHNQISEFVGVPNKYYKRMLSEAPQLLVNNVNHWLRSEDSNQRMVRTLDGRTRAFLSDKYRPLDNMELAELAFPILKESGCEITSCEITEKRMYIKAVTPKLEYEVKKGDVVQAGIVISNSEVGMGALSVEPLLYRLVCLNGMIINDAKMRRTHVGRGNEQFSQVSEFFRDSTREADDKVFWMKVRDVISASFSATGFDKFVARFSEAQNDKVTGSPMKVLDVTQKLLGFSEHEKETVLKHFLIDNDMSRFGLANAITRASQDLDNYDRATEFERIGGNVIELNKRDWSTIAEAN